ncbi:MAG: hypothetical protein NT000_08115 [Proteobacteria bacterium]|nr:hypothetical protein [Pseudomonadota bacterium]
MRRAKSLKIGNLVFILLKGLYFYTEQSGYVGCLAIDICGVWIALIWSNRFC